MGDLDPAQAASLGDLARCLRQVRLRADKPSFRVLEERTKHANGLLPGTKIERVPLRRSTLSEVLQGQAFPRKGFLLTFVEACGVDLEADHRWERAWDRLADQDRDQDRETQESGMPAFITRKGRFVAVITSLAPGQVESRVLAELAREIGK